MAGCEILAGKRQLEVCIGLLRTTIANIVVVLTRLYLVRVAGDSLAAISKPAQRANNCGG